jgi:hypothetical protein
MAGLFFPRKIYAVYQLLAGTHRNPLRSQRMLGLVRFFVKKRGIAFSQNLYLVALNLPVVKRTIIAKFYIIKHYKTSLYANNF